MSLLGGVHVVSISRPAVVAGGGDSEIRIGFFFLRSSRYCSWCLRIFVELLLPAMEVTAGTRAGGSAVSGLSSTGSFSPDGLSVACSAIPPDQRAVGQPLHRCSCSA
jgi:hypothetical protein